MKLRNWTIDQIEIGQTAEMRRLVLPDDLYVSAVASGNHNPMHLPNEDGDGDGVVDAIVPGMFVASLISAVLGMQLPGPGTLYRCQTLDFHRSAHAGEELIARVRVIAKQDGGIVTFATDVRRASDDAPVVTGEAQVTAPRRSHSFEDSELPGLIVQRHRHFEAVLDRARPLPALTTAVVCPEEADALAGAILAADEGIITPVLIGRRQRILAVAQDLGIALDRYELIEAPTGEAAATKACELVHAGRAAAVMKGHLHTDDLLRPMLDKVTGLRIGRRFTHVFVMDVPGMPAPIMVTDAAINIAPDLKTKIDIVQNAIDLARSLGIEHPRVGVLSAVETVNPEIQSSVDAALLSKMAERGQITGGYVDGPLAMDNAISMAAARTKNIRSEVAGRADILVVPGIDAGNMLAKQLAFVSHAEAAGLVLGARVPVILNSRSDNRMSRLASCAVAALYQAAAAQRGAQ